MRSYLELVINLRDYCKLSNAMQRSHQWWIPNYTQKKPLRRQACIHGYTHSSFFVLCLFEQCTRRTERRVCQPLRGREIYVQWMNKKLQRCRMFTNSSNEVTPYTFFHLQTNIHYYNNLKVISARCMRMKMNISDWWQSHRTDKQNAILFIKPFIAWNANQAINILLRCQYGCAHCASFFPLLYVRLCAIIKLIFFCLYVFQVLRQLR